MRGLYDLSIPGASAYIDLDVCVHCGVVGDDAAKEYLFPFPLMAVGSKRRGGSLIGGVAWAMVGIALSLSVGFVQASNLRGRRAAVASTPPTDGQAEQGAAATPLEPPSAQARRRQALSLSLDMARHSMLSYLTYGFPFDELDSMSCGGTDSFGGFYTTLVDGLDTMALVGAHHTFREYASFLCRRLRFDADVNVSVFETNIRLLGGLLSAHLMVVEGIVEWTAHQTGGTGGASFSSPYDGCLLQQAHDLALRLLPAFDTASGIPFGVINLAHGVHASESRVTSAAGGGTFMLEFSLMTALTGDDRFLMAARRAAVAIFDSRRASAISVVASHLNVDDGTPALRQSLVGTGGDSFYEYLLKTFVLTGDAEFHGMFQVMRHANAMAMRKVSFHVEVDLTGRPVGPIHSSLAAFYPGMLALAGELDEAERLAKAQHAVFSRFGAMPEGLNLWSNEPHDGQEVYPLRPEHMESLYVLWSVTRDPFWVDAAVEAAIAVNTRTRVPCGFAGLASVTAPPLVSVPRDVAKFDKKRRRRFAAAAQAHHRREDHPETRDGSGSTTTDDSAVAAAAEMSHYPHHRLVEGARLTAAQHHASTPQQRAVRALGEHGERFADRMPSFFISETVKYLVVLFYDAVAARGEPVPGTNADLAPLLEQAVTRFLARDWVFNTEGHPFPVRPQWAEALRTVKQRRYVAPAQASGATRQRPFAAPLEWRDVTFTRKELEIIRRRGFPVPRRSLR